MKPSKLVEDRSSTIARDNLGRIKLIAIAGTSLLECARRERAERLIRNRCAWDAAPPFLMVAVHNAPEYEAARRFAQRFNGGLGGYYIVPQNGHNETVGSAIRLYRDRFDRDASPAEAKREILFLTHRGGKGKPRFVSQFTGGEGTTCGAWTPVLARATDGKPARGFMKASLVVGFCPVGCPFCYLQMPYTDGMDVALNWEDLATELKRRWQGFKYPINFGETSGLVEYDEWFADEAGNGSMIQFVIDACAEARVTPFFLTKIRYPHYLRFHGTVQVGISLMPEAIRTWLAPHGSPADELLGSLAQAVQRGAASPVVRLTVLWQYRDFYPELLAQCQHMLGDRGWRLTVDILRFTPSTASTVARHHPEAAAVFARELDPGQRSSLSDLARDAGGEKKIRPPVERQVEIYTWLRETLDGLGCHEVELTPCKGDPEELAPLARQKILSAMPCACYLARENHRRPPVSEPALTAACV